MMMMTTTTTMFRTFVMIMIMVVVMATTKTIMLALENNIIAQQAIRIYCYSFINAAIAYTGLLVRRDIIIDPSM